VTGNLNIDSGDAAAGGESLTAALLARGTCRMLEQLG